MERALAYLDPVWGDSSILSTRPHNFLDRIPFMGVKRRRVPLGKCLVARWRCRSSLARSRPARPALRMAGGGPLRHSSGPSRIRGVDHGKEERPLRLVLLRFGAHLSEMAQSR